MTEEQKVIDARKAGEITEEEARRRLASIDHARNVADIIRMNRSGPYGGFYSGKRRSGLHRRGQHR